VALWWLTPPLKVAMLLTNTPPQMLTEFKAVASTPVPLGAKILAASLLALAIGLLAAMLFLSAKACCRGFSRAMGFLHVVRWGPGIGDVETTANTFVSMVDRCDMATPIVECGWGTSFHFAERHCGETPLQSIVRHEYFLAGRVGVRQGARLLDCGCGLGGPARNIARFTGARVTAVTRSRYQAERGNYLSRKEGMQDRVEMVHADLMKLPFPDASFDAVYAIESTCRTPDRVGVYSEILRVLKPGGIFACYEWCLTDKYSAFDERHVRIKEAIEVGDPPAPLCSAGACEQALTTLGFRLIESQDCASFSPEGGDPWYRPLTASYNPMHWPRLQFTPPMRAGVPFLFRLGERLRLLPAGAAKTQVALQAGAEGLAQGGAEGIFTPMWLLVAEKVPNRS